MSSLYEQQRDAALSDKLIALYWVEHYQAMPRLTDGQRTTLAVYQREAAECQRMYLKVKNLGTGQTRTERSRAARKVVTQ